ncbi:MAG: Glu-tRNA(Gln) amidotransferase subunit GatE [Euryarchaeota archaeon]
MGHVRGVAVKELDYKKVGFKAGLEIHQQLNTASKLFCSSPTELRDTKDAVYEFYRYLRPSKSELGEIDRAAIEEGVGTRRFAYKAYASTGLVENDDEPPMEMNLEALKFALQIALLLQMKPFEQVHTMRKLVIDGSNTSGFQRTALLAVEGQVSLRSGPVRIDTLSVEEEAAQIVDKDVYSLDRLGIPLVEIGTAPDLKTPEMVKELALTIGTILRACRVKRGLGTIRQDINISIVGGARVEIKGVQALDLIEDIVRLEVTRQLCLLKIRDELKARGARVGSPIEVTSIFTQTESNILKKKNVWGVLLPGFAGLVGKEIQSGHRLGSEFADRAKKKGVAGIFHTDELPQYGITEQEKQALLQFLEAGENDAIVILAHENERTCIEAISAVKGRAQESIEGVPEETRRALDDGCSEYLRPLPGAARMYPETDVSPISLPKTLVERIKQQLPELLSDRAQRYKRDFLLNDELAQQIARSDNNRLFEQVMDLWCGQDGCIEKDEAKDAATLVVRTLEGTIAELKRDGAPFDRLTREQILDVFWLVRSKTISKEGVPEVLRSLAECDTKTAGDAAEELGLTMLSERELQAIVNEVVYSHLDFIKAKGAGAVGPLMGVVMKQVRGKADGRIVSEVLQSKVLSVLQ